MVVFASIFLLAYFLLRCFFLRYFFLRYKESNKVVPIFEA